MYSACLYCSKSLGSNEVIEQFPVGRRLAFDGVKGRLWVVCPSCQRWCLAPIEERWEAIEACERAFRETRVRASTPEISLVRLREGLELVRVARRYAPRLPRGATGGNSALGAAARWSMAREPSVPELSVRRPR